jgi:hypothetical protein
LDRTFSCPVGTMSSSPGKSAESFLRRASKVCQPATRATLRAAGGRQPWSMNSTSLGGFSVSWEACWTGF